MVKDVLTGGRGKGTGEGLHDPEPLRYAPPNRFTRCQRCKLPLVWCAIHNTYYHGTDLTDLKAFIVRHDQKWHNIADVDDNKRTERQWTEGTIP